MLKIDEIMKELAEYTRIAEEANAAADALKDALKAEMDARGVDTLRGAEHKATYKAVESRRVDTTALKRDMPDVAAQYTRVTTCKRFTFA